MDNKSQKTKLLICSGILLLCSTIGFGFVPIVSDISTRKNAEIERLDLLQAEIRNSLDYGTLQWELARIFLNHGIMLKKLYAGAEILEQNLEHYRYNISNADAYVNNAAYGFQDSKSTIAQRNVLFWYPKRSIEEIRISFPANVVEANKRSNRIIAERNLRRVQSRHWNLAKTILHMSSLIINSIGIAFGIFALRYDSRK